jgi:PKD repeat protein
MNEQKKLFTVFLVIVVLIVSGFVAVVQYQIGGITTEEELPLTVKVFADKEEGLTPFAINFTSIVQHFEGNLKYSWDFGDGETSKEINPSHTYEETGEYTCLLSVADSRGKKSEDTIKILVKRNKPPVVTLALNQNTLERMWIPIISILPLWPGDVQKIINIIEERNPYAFGEGRIVCTAQVDDPENDEIISYKWTHIAETQLSKWGSPEQPTHTMDGNKTIRLPEIYTWPGGTHVLKLTVEDSAGNTANASIEFMVEESIKKINRNRNVRVIKGAFDQWLLYGKPILGAAIAGLLLGMWRYSNFTGVKLVTLVVLNLLLQLDMGDALLIQAKEFLDEHPRILNFVDNRLVDLQNRLKNSDRLPSDIVNNTVDSIENLREQLGLANKRPVIFNAFPQPGDENIPVDCPYVSVNVSDFEGDPFNVTISGDYVNDITYNGEYNGTFNATLITPLPDRERIYWHVEVVDHNGKIVQGDYQFKTFVEV